MAAIVGVTAVLVTEPPAKASVAVPKYATDTVPLGPLELNYIVEPAKTGPNTIHLYFFKPKSGFPASVDDAKLSATLPSQNLGPLRIPLTRIVPRHYTTSARGFRHPRPAAPPATEPRPEPLHDLGRGLSSAGRLAGDGRGPPRRVPVVHANSDRSHQKGLPCEKRSAFSRCWGSRSSLQRSLTSSPAQRRCRRTTCPRSPCRPRAKRASPR